jgi:hypothetical protein
MPGDVSQGVKTFFWSMEPKPNEVELEDWSAVEIQIL